ncbi:LysR family transcriptional regulator [Pantoea stewartii]|uniref:LysR family transcriptional regulator n=1 Tax=Pantoea stewartii TaxID=66269 RepID=UPI0023F6461D|nr:LysR family transcriptional regulator [Pantoea stewartii]MDF7788617.1 LysR family transcriptional regulator [Pantoea stewartii]
MKNRKNAIVFDWIIYVKVVELKSFSLAARELHLSISTVSKTVTKLEDILSTRLLSRNAHRFEITSAGEIAYKSALEMCEVYHNLLDEMNDKNVIKGELRLSAPGNLCNSVINDWIIEYTEQHPDAKIHLLAREAGSFTSDSPEFDDLVIKSGYLDSPDLIHKSLNPVEFGIYASRDYLNMHTPLTEPEDLNRHSLLRLNHLLMRSPLTFTKSGEERQCFIRGEREFYSNNTCSLLHMAKKNKGVCLAVPCWEVIHSPTCMTLNRVLSDWALTPIPAYIVWRYRKKYSLFFRDFSLFLENKWNAFFH